MPGSLKNAHGYIEKWNGHKYLTLVPTDESENKLKKYEEICSKIKVRIWSTDNNSDDYYEKHMKFKFNSDDDSPLKKH